MKICRQCNIEKEENQFYYRNDINAYRNECKECTKKAKAIREAAPGVKEERARKERERRALHGEEINAKIRAYRRTEHSKAVQREWCQNNRHKTRVYNNTQRAKRKYAKTVGSPATSSEIFVWHSEQLPLCVYCYKPLTKESMSLDHIEPLSKGGTHSLDNLALCCKNCNSSKTNRSLLIFLAHKLVETKDKKP